MIHLTRFMRRHGAISKWHLTTRRVTLTMNLPGWVRACIFFISDETIFLCWKMYRMTCFKWIHKEVSTRSIAASYFSCSALISFFSTLFANKVPIRWDIDFYISPVINAWSSRVTSHCWVESSVARARSLLRSSSRAQSCSLHSHGWHFNSHDTPKLACLHPWSGLFWMGISSHAFGRMGGLPWRTSASYQTFWFIHVGENVGVDEWGTVGGHSGTFVAARLFKTDICFEVKNLVLDIQHSM